MRRGLLAAAIVALALATAGCGGSGSSSTTGGATPSCAPSGSILTETVKNVSFGATCLAAPANAAFKINFDNQDAGIPHNLEIFDKDPKQDSSAKSLFKGTVVTGPTQTTYDVAALAPGTYHFHCDIHPDQMTGTLVIGS